MAGAADVLAPRAAVRHIADLLPNAEQVTLRDAPGGHLGVLTGRSARRTTWPEIDEFLAANDAVELKPKGRRRAAASARERVAAQPA